MEPGTELHERLARLEEKVNGGPGQSPICKIHERAVEEIKCDLKAIREFQDRIYGQMRYWAGGIAVLCAMAPFAKELVMHFVSRKP